MINWETDERNDERPFITARAVAHTLWGTVFILACITSFNFVNAGNWAMLLVAVFIVVLSGTILYDLGHGPSSPRGRRRGQRGGRHL